MRISTNQIFDSGSSSILNSQSNLYKLQNQLSSGRRVLTPQDDPVAASQALVVTQSKEVNAQYIDNQGAAKSQLGLVDSQLATLINVLQNIRTTVVAAGNTGTTSQSDRETMATEIESRLSEIMGIANSDNGVGEYLFSGYKGNVTPFAVNTAEAVMPPATTAPITYYGDEGERLLQVSASRQIGISVAGSDVFMTGKTGNGTFVATSDGNNTGTATIDAGSVLDQQTWALAVNNAAAGQPIEIRFTDSTHYGIYDPVSGSTTGPLPYTSGTAIPLKTAAGVDFGSQVIVQGQPAAGDKFEISASTNQSVFQTVQNLIGILRSPIGASTYTNTQFSNELSAELTNIDQSLSNISRVQSIVGTRMQEIESLGSLASDLDIQYESNLSDLQELDYAKAISDFIKQQMNLEAAQSSFAKITGLSLFNYI